jgi:hypothetical protein
MAVVVGSFEFSSALNFFALGLRQVILAMISTAFQSIGSKGVCGAIVGILRYLLRRSTGNKETTTHSELAKELNAAAEALPDAEKNIQKAISLSAHVQAKATVTANLSVVVFKRQKSFVPQWGEILSFSYGWRR